MFGRENLNGRDMVKFVKSVNEIMDKMENRIKELETENNQLKQELDKEEKLMK